MKKFEEFVPKELFMSMERDGQGSDASLSRQAMNEVEKGCLQYLEYLRNEGVLAPAEEVAGHDIHFLNIWNDFVAKKNFLDPEHDMYDLMMRNHVMGYFIERLHFMPFEYYFHPERETLAKWELKYKLVAEAFNQGAFKLVDALHSHMVDEESGGRVACVFDKWKPVFGFPKTSAKEQYLEPLAPRGSIGIQHIEQELKTGNLLVCNGLAAIRGLKEILATGDIDLNSTKGLVEYTQALAKHGIMHVFVGNTCPNVYQRNGALIVGQHDEDEHEIESAGMVITDLWWVTLVERETLEALLATKIGAEKAEVEVNEFLEMMHDEVMQIKVDPGIHHLYFHGHYEQLAGELDTDEILTDAVEPYFVLTERTLGLKQEQKPVSRPKI